MSRDRVYETREALEDAVAYVRKYVGKPLYIAGMFCGVEKLPDVMNNAANVHARSFREYMEIWDYLIEEITPEMYMLIKAEEVSPC